MEARWIVPIPAGRPNNLRFLKPLMAIRIVQRLFSSLAGGISHSLHIRKTQPIGWKKRRTNKQAWISSKRKKGGCLWHFLCIRWANTIVYSSENSHKATSNADLNSHVGHPGICGSTGPSSRLPDFWWLVSSLPDSHLPDCLFCQLDSAAPFCWLCPSLDCSLMPTYLYCSLLLNVPFCFLLDLTSLVPPVSWEISSADPLWVSCQNKQRDSLTGTHTHRNGCHP